MPQPTPKPISPKRRRNKKLIFTILVLAGMCLLFLLIQQPQVYMRFSRMLQKSGQQDVFSQRLTPEVPIAKDIRVENWYAYHRCSTVTCTIYARSDSQHLELRRRLRNSRSAVDDAVRTVISTAPLQDIRDPQLNWVKDQLQNRMETIVGTGMVDEILIPMWHAGPGSDSREPPYGNARSLWQSEY
ncbi:MAG: hypothetical protein JW936_05490 [Sedimentisphaerales bacterium]|nr:hypothetical protein [Sedimentisphaerales bacterium]